MPSLFRPRLGIAIVALAALAGVLAVVASGRAPAALFGPRVGATGGSCSTGPTGGSGPTGPTCPSGLDRVVTSFTASRRRGAVVVRWQSASDRATLGYHVYRQVGSKRVRLNPALIHAKSRIGGHAYSYRDARAPSRGALRYWLRSIGTDGLGIWFGPARVAP